MLTRARRPRMRDCRRRAAPRARVHLLEAVRAICRTPRGDVVRFAVAFVTLLVALVLVGTGFAQRTVLKPADHVSVAADIPADVHYVVIPGSVLRSHVGGQRIQLAGSDVVFAGYGR